MKQSDKLTNKKLNDLQEVWSVVSPADDDDMILVPREQALDLIAEVRRLRSAIRSYVGDDHNHELFSLVKTF